MEKVLISLVNYLNLIDTNIVLLFMSCIKMGVIRKERKQYFCNS